MPNNNMWTPESLPLRQMAQFKPTVDFKQTPPEAFLTAASPEVSEELAEMANMIRAAPSLIPLYAHALESDMLSRGKDPQPSDTDVASMLHQMHVHLSRRRTLKSTVLEMMRQRSVVKAFGDSAREAALIRRQTQRLNSQHMPRVPFSLSGTPVLNSPKKKSVATLEGRRPSDLRGAAVPTKPAGEPTAVGGGSVRKKSSSLLDRKLGSGSNSPTARGQATTAVASPMAFLGFGDFTAEEMAAPQPERETPDTLQMTDILGTSTREFTYDGVVTTVKGPSAVDKMAISGRRNSTVLSLHEDTNDIDELNEEEDEKTFSFGDFDLSGDSNSILIDDHDEVDDSAERFCFGDFDVGVMSSEGSLSQTGSGKTKPKAQAAVSAAPPPQSRLQKPRHRNEFVKSFKVESMLGHESRVKCLAISGRNIASACSLDSSVTMWCAGSVVQKYIGHEDLVTAVAFSYCGKVLLTASKDKTARTWDIQTAKQKVVFEHLSAVTCAVFCQNGRFMVTGSQDGICRIWTTKGKVRQSTPKSSYIEHGSVITCVCFQPYGEHVISGSADKTVRLWSAASSQTVVVQKKIYVGTVLQTQFSPNGKYFVTLEMAAVRIFSMEDNDKPLHVIAVGRSYPKILTGLSPADEANYYFITATFAPTQLQDHLCLTDSYGFVRLIRFDRGVVATEGSAQEVVAVPCRERVVCLGTDLTAAPARRARGVRPMAGTTTTFTSVGTPAPDNYATVCFGDFAGNMSNLVLRL